MPELAEVEYYRKQWNPGIGGRISRVAVNAGKRVFRECPVEALAGGLAGSVFTGSERHGKQMLFRFSGGCLGLHLGMTGKLHVLPAAAIPEKHDHLVLVQEERLLVFTDPRQFGALRFSAGPETPDWWQLLPPEVTSQGFTRERVGAFLQRRARSPIKAVLLMQEVFPGIGNWMADEILWRARIRPDCFAGRISGRKLTALFEATVGISREALRIIGTDWSDPPESWLFLHRWRDGGHCPQTGKPLRRDAIGGRTTCWSPSWQTWPRD